jgi:hypothetical protein
MILKYEKIQTKLKVYEGKLNDWQVFIKSGVIKPLSYGHLGNAWRKGRGE